MYDPEGVGGTHVMYVLHHADQPQLYSGLAKAPTISGIVSAWKGPAKPIGVAAMVLTALVGAAHYIRNRPSEVTKADEQAAAALAEAEQRAPEEERHG